MLEKSTTKCRIFVSRKTSDKELSKKIRRQLRKFGPNLEFFDASDIEPGDGWRHRLRKELKKANILLLVLTKPAEDDFDWPLYEAGLFESLDSEDCRRVICVYADSGDTKAAVQRAKLRVPSQLGDKQAVKATEEEILDLLVRLFHDKEFTGTEEPLNSNVDREEDLRSIARTIAEDINGVPGDQLKHRKYCNTYVQLQLAPDAKLDSDTAVESNEESLSGLFGLGKNPPNGQETWTWEQISSRVEGEGPDSINRRWIQQLEDAVSAMRAGERVHQLTSRFLAEDGKLYRPELEIYRTYENRRMTIDVTFSEQVQDSWLRNASAPVALAANLALASRIRHELIERYLRKVPLWQTEKEKEKGSAVLSQLVEDIEHDGYFIGRLTKNQLQDAFELADNQELAGLRQEYGMKIRPLLGSGLQNLEVTEIGQALERWEKNNLRFLHIGLRRYKEMLGPPAIGAVETRRAA